MTDTDLRWLVSERPAPVGLDAHTTARARRQLLEHTARSRHRRWRRRWPLAIAAAAAAAGAGLVVMAPAPRAPLAPRAARPAVVVRSQLVQLADYIRAGTPAPGDATLVERTQSYPSRPSITGADLYTDAGKYFYAQTPAGLPAAVRADANVGNGFMSRELTAARLAAAGEVQTARTRMADATYTPGQPPQGAPAAVKAKLEAMLRIVRDAGLKARLRRDLTRIEQGRPLISQRARQDNMVWENSLDTLVAGATDPQVRAGVLRLLATMSEVRVTRTTAEGRPALDILAGPPALPSDYQEELIIDADTGVPLRFVGGAPGRTPGVIVTYRVSRVTIADIAAGHIG